MTPGFLLSLTLVLRNSTRRQTYPTHRNPLWRLDLGRHCHPHVSSQTPDTWQLGAKKRKNIQGRELPTAKELLNCADVGRMPK